MSVNKGVPLWLALFKLSYACYSVLAEFEELFQPILFQSVCLRVVRCTFLVYDRVVRCKFPNDVIDDVPTLLTNKLDWESIPAPKMFVHEFGRGCCRVVS